MNSLSWKFIQIEIFDKNWYLKKNRFAFSKRVEIISEVLKQISPKQVLDLGTGDGEMLIELKTSSLSYCKFVGCDISKELIKIAKKLSIKYQFAETIQFIVADMENLPFRDGEFDSVICTAVVEHISNLKKATNELSRVTKNGRLSIFTVPNTLYQPLFNLLAKLHLRYNDRVFYKKITLDNLINYLKKSGLIPIFRLNFVLPIPKLFNFLEKIIQRVQLRSFHPFLNQLLVCKKISEK
ncbi:MAG: class I SAM-dependent methyltransferase [Candidatus Helarchaeota archaeon]